MPLLRRQLPLQRRQAEGASLKILVVAPAWIGDTILAQPLLTRLSQQHGQLQLDVLAPAWSAPLLRRMAEVRRVITNPLTHGEFKLGERLRLARGLRREAYDEAIVLPNSWKSALIPFLAGIPKRTGFVGEARYFLLNRLHRYDKRTLPQLALRYAKLAEDPAAPPAQPLAGPQLISTAQQQAAARAALALPPQASPVVFCPGAEYGPAKRWPARHFAALAERLGDAAQPVWLVGSDKDRALGEEIARAARGAALNLCGRTTLEQAIDLLAGARLIVANDSGLMHVAAALARPLLALYGSSSPGFTPPLSSHAKIIATDIACSPCFQRVCPLGHFKCLEDLTPERVLQHLDHHAKP